MYVLMQEKKLHSLLSKVAMALLVLGVLWSCAQTEVMPETGGDTSEAVAFEALMLNVARDTRAGRMGELTTDNLKAADAGFGVFACNTGNAPWDTWKTGTASLMNFMFNQQVAWENDLWVYSPVKYWPNGVDAANASDTPSHTATEKDVQYLSFFAYAPYVETTPSTGVVTDDDTQGIVGMTANSGKAKDASLTYRTSNVTPFDPTKSVDLLWGVRGAFNYQETDGTVNSVTTLGASHNIDLTKQTVDERVSFLFKHALSKFTITVQGLFDHTDNDDTSPEYPVDVDDNTKILIESVDFDDSPLFKQGKMYLAPATDDAEEPTWEDLTEKGTPALSIRGTDINEDLSDTYMVEAVSKSYHRDYLEDKANAADAKTLFDALPRGVTHTEQSLFNDDETYYLVIPNKKHIADHSDDVMKIHMVYDVITYDPNLKLNTPQYFSIVKNDITATFSSAFAFEANKSYKLRLQPGLTTVKFEVAVGEWDTPITLDPLVIDWQIETHEYNIGYDSDDSTD